MLATIHADANMATAAHYRRPPYVWQSVNVILSQPTDVLGAVRAGTLAADMLTSSVTDTPQRGDQIRIGQTIYTVQDTERDVLGLSWRLTLSDST